MTCVTVDNGFIFLSFRTPGTLTSIAFLPRTAEDDRVEGALAIKLIIGLDFAVTLSSPDSSCVLLDITSEQSVELKWLMLIKQTQKMIPFVTCEISLGLTASWFLVSMYLIWILGPN